MSITFVELASIFLSRFSKNQFAIWKMSRQYDFIVFGATGFTGQYVAEEISRIAGEEHISWAVAGRNVDKMKTILGNVEKTTGMYHCHKYRTLMCQRKFYWCLNYQENLLVMLVSSWLW